MVYLDVWERHITALEDDDIREKALGGPDTATRTKVVWQVKIDDGKDTARPHSVHADDVREVGNLDRTLAAPTSRLSQGARRSPGRLEGSLPDRPGCQISRSGEPALPGRNSSRGFR